MGNRGMRGNGGGGCRDGRWQAACDGIGAGDGG